jgi:predicted ABC-type ATPase
VASRRSRIVVVAGTNGAGKSSIASGFLPEARDGYFNPDTFASRLVGAGKPPLEANAVAWRSGYERLRAAIDRGQSFTFETTLGGDSIIAELLRALKLRRAVRVFYVGLSSVDLHIDRVRARVARGGHDIPVAKIRERYSKSLANLLKLIGAASGVQVLDNSAENADGFPETKLVFRMRGRRIVEPSRARLLATCPEWAKPIAAAAIRAATKGRR